MYLKSSKSIKCRRYVKRTTFFSANFFKKINVFNNIGLNKQISSKYTKIKKYNKKKNQKYRARALRDINLYKLLLGNGYTIIWLKKKSTSNHTLGFAQTIKMFKKEVYLKKQFLFNTKTFVKKFKRVRLNCSYFFFNIFFGFRLNVSQYNTNNRLKFFNLLFFSLGSVVNLMFISFGHICYNIINFKKNIKYSSAPGTYTVLLEHRKESKLSLIQLPSGKLKLINYYNLAIIGRCANIFSKYRVIGKASNYFFWKKKKVKVRGVAMNPVDHPNGGRTKVKKPFKSVWGWVAKKNK